MYVYTVIFVSDRKHFKIVMIENKGIVTLGHRPQKT